MTVSAGAWAVGRQAHSRLGGRRVPQSPRAVLLLLLTFLGAQGSCCLNLWGQLRIGPLARF